MKVVHITPSFFDAQGRLGGGERYAYELARTMAREVPTELISFSKSPRVYHDGKLLVRLLKHHGSIDGNIVNPWPVGLLRYLRSADVIQMYQMRTLATDLALLAGRWWKKKVFIADMGGWGRIALSYHCNLDKLAAGYLLLSRDCLSDFVVKDRPLHVLYGGVDPFRFFPSGKPYDSKRVLFVGRTISAKGIDYLIRALPKDMELWIIGQVVDPKYRETLQALAEGKRIRFMSDITDEALREAYQTSLVTVLPSVTRMEKLGLVLLESMACGTPVICSRIGGMPEIVEDGVTGFTVQPGNVQALTEKILRLRSQPEERKELSEAGLVRMATHFSWDSVVRKNLEIYQKSQLGGVQ